VGPKMPFRSLPVLVKDRCTLIQALVRSGSRCDGFLLSKAEISC
jgi:hypothetical protein